MKTEIMEAGAFLIEKEKAPFGLFKVIPTFAEKGHIFVAFGPASAVTFSGNEIVVQPNGNPRDMSVDYYLFECIEQWKFARKCTGLDRVGWKSVAGLLYRNSWDDLSRFIRREDYEPIANLPGFGSKMGKKILDEVIGAPKDLKATEPNSDAVDTLVALGWNKTEAKNRVLEVMDANPDAPTETIVKLCLSRSN